MGAETPKTDQACKTVALGLPTRSSVRESFAQLRRRGNAADPAHAPRVPTRSWGPDQQSV